MSENREKTLEKSRTESGFARTDQEQSRVLREQIKNRDHSQKQCKNRDRDKEQLK